MKTMIKAQLLDGSWHDAWLTDERAESSYGQPVVVVEGDDVARGPAEIGCLKVSRTMRYWALATGYQLDPSYDVE